MKTVNIGSAAYFVDDNMNTWDTSTFSEGEAEKNSRGLIGCDNCVDCIRCTDCALCVGCVDCEDCSYCSNCVKCNTCQRCHGCDMCSACESCMRCVSCGKCDFSQGLIDCHRTSHSHDCSHSTRCHRCENIRKSGPNSDKDVSNTYHLFEGIEGFEGLTERPELQMKLFSYCLLLTKKGDMKIADNSLTSGKTYNSFAGIRDVNDARSKKLFPLLDAFMRTVRLYFFSAKGNL